MTKLTTLNILLLVSLCWATGSSLALPGDRDQPINISSDRAERDEKTGVTIYIGDVELNQGSLSISSDRLEIHMSGVKVIKMVATGIPARVRQLPNTVDGEVRAKGNTIKYFLDEEKLELIDDASIEQDGSRVASDRIDYFINEEFVKARSTSGQNGRVNVVIPPNRATTSGITAKTAAVVSAPIMESTEEQASPLPSSATPEADDAATPDPEAAESAATTPAVTPSQP